MNQPLNRSQEGIVEFKNSELLRIWLSEHGALFLSPPRLNLLSGPMGVGKTQIIRWLLSSLGVGESASPSFAIRHEYSQNNLIINHFDLYRIQDSQELEATDFWDVLSQCAGLVFVEWADRLDLSSYPQNWPTTCVRLDFISPEISSARRLTWQTMP